MSGFLNMDVIGLEATLLRFAELEVASKLAEKPIAEAMAAPVLERARQLVPVDTGRLRDSLHEEADPEDSGAVLVGTDVEYAPFPEFGTANMAAEPYLRPAIDSGTERAISEAVPVLLRLLGIGL